MHHKLYPKTPCINTAESTRCSKIRYTFLNISKYNMTDIHRIIVRHTDCQSEGDTWTVPAPKTSKMIAVMVFLHFLYTENCQQVWYQAHRFCRKKPQNKSSSQVSSAENKTPSTGKLCSSLSSAILSPSLLWEATAVLCFANTVIVRESKTS